jgi:hypothetical protein
MLSEVAGRKQVADLMALDPILYALDNRYYRVGAVIGVGYREAQRLKRSIPE